MEVCFVTNKQTTTLYVRHLKTRVGGDRKIFVNGYVQMWGNGFGCN